ncbi:MAG: hypothetical protein ACUZ8I_14945 [Candidatus Scalindua sp.]
MSIFRIELGVKAEDIITGFKGTVTARAEYLNGCIRYQIENKPKKAEEDSNEWWFDDGRVKVASNKKVILQDKVMKSTGGPQSKMSV